MNWEWHSAWASSAQPQELESREVLLLHDEGGRLAAILPFQLATVPFHRTPSRSILWAIGDLGCPDHLDLAALPGTDLTPFVDLLSGQEWDTLTLENLAEDTPNLTEFARLCQERGWTTRDLPRWSCPCVDLPSTWEEYVANLSPNRRDQVQRKERKLRREHDVRITDWRGTDLQEGWDLFKELHGLRWPGTSTFEDPTVDALHRRFVSLMDERGELWLTSVHLDGRPAAVCYGFTRGDTAYFYQSGRDPEFDRMSVGFVLIAHLVRRAIERGFRRFDLLRGDEPYKAHWATGTRRTHALVVFRQTLRGRVLRRIDDLAQLVRRVTAQ